MNHERPINTLLRIAIVTSIHPDFDKRVWRHATMVSGLGHQVELICPWKVTEGDRCGNITFHPFSPRQSRVDEVLRLPWRLGGKLLSMLPALDLVHFHEPDLLPWMVLLSKPCVYDVHENYPLDILERESFRLPYAAKKVLSRCAHWAQFIAARKIKNVVLVAPSQHKDFASPRLNIIEIRNYATRELLKSSVNNYGQRAPAVIFTGSQYINNGTHLFLEIAARMQAVRPDVTFYMVDWLWSSGSARAEVLGLIAKRKLTNLVILPPIPAPELMKYLNLATIGVSLNLRTQMQIDLIPTKLFEYMAASLPMVVSDLPYAEQIIKDTNAGLLAKPEDPETFVAAILRLVNDTALAQRLGENGRQAFLDRYSWESQAERLDQFYQGIVARSVLRSMPNHG